MLATLGCVYLHAEDLYISLLSSWYDLTKEFNLIDSESNAITITYRRGDVVVRVSASQSVDLGFISLVESYQKTLKNGIHSFPAWRSAQKG